MGISVASAASLPLGGGIDDGRDRRRGSAAGEYVDANVRRDLMH